MGIVGSKYVGKKDEIFIISKGGYGGPDYNEYIFFDLESNSIFYNAFKNSNRIVN